MYESIYAHIKPPQFSVYWPQKGRSQKHRVMSGRFPAVRCILPARIYSRFTHLIAPRFTSQQANELARKDPCIFRTKAYFEKLTHSCTNHQVQRGPFWAPNCRSLAFGASREFASFQTYPENTRDRNTNQPKTAQHCHDTSIQRRASRVNHW